jgi:WD40 repeat protein
MRRSACGFALLAMNAVLALSANAADGVDLYGDPLPPGARLRLGTARFRHPSLCVAYSPDGKLLASGGDDNSIRLFDATTGKEVRTLPGHQARTYEAPRNSKDPKDVLIASVKEGHVNSLAFCPDARLLASAGWDDSVRLWDVATGKQVRRLEAHVGMVAKVAFSPDGKTLASRGGLDGTLRLWDVATGRELHTVTGLSNVNPWRFNREAALAFAPDGTALAVGDKNAIHFFDVSTAREKGHWDAHLACLSLAYSPDARVLASGGVDGKDKNGIRLWDVASGKELRRCTLVKDEPPIHLAFAPTGDRLAAVIEEDDLHVFDVNTGKSVQRLKHYWPSRVAYSPDGQTLASARGPVLRLWDTATGKEKFAEFQGHQAGVAAVVVSADGKTIATGGEQIIVWDAAGGRLRLQIPAGRGVAALALSPDGKTLASAGRDRIVHLWDVGTGKSVKDLPGHKHALCGLAFSPDVKKIASGDAQSTLRIWDIAGGAELRVIDVKSLTERLALAFAPDSRTLACAGAWNDSSFLPKGGINIQGVEVTAKEGYRVLAWDVASGKEVLRCEGLSANLTSLAYSPDGGTLAAAARDGRLALWDAATGKERLFILAHPNHADAPLGAAPSVAFAPDGKTLASASGDRTVRIWDAGTGKELGRFEGPRGGFTCLAFLPDGKSLVTGCADTTALVWDLATARPAPSREPKVIFIGD